MGGQNHQPTRTSLTAVSAWLSLQLSDGFSSVLDANADLERAVILGMDRLYVEDFASSLESDGENWLRGCRSKLERSLAILADIDMAFERLFQAAKKEGYLGNPHAQEVHKLGLQSKMAGKLVEPRPNALLWSELEHRISKNNILETLAWERDEIRKLREPTSELILVVDRLVAHCRAHGPQHVVDIIERNQINLRQAFARVFSRWNHVHAMFLYSALLMTELFYRAEGYPSLLEEEALESALI